MIIEHAPAIKNTLLLLRESVKAVLIEETTYKTELESASTRESTKFRLMSKDTDSDVRRVRLMVEYSLGVPDLLISIYSKNKKNKTKKSSKYLVKGQSKLKGSIKFPFFLTQLIFTKKTSKQTTWHMSTSTGALPILPSPLIP